METNPEKKLDMLLDLFQYFLRGMETIVAFNNPLVGTMFQYFLRGMETGVVPTALFLSVSVSILP